jgi:2-C-methyl-D-erythritol 4-phosphate cytidylyltransferase
VTSGGSTDVVPTIRVGVVVPASGMGRRMGGVQKPLLELCGEPVLLWAIRPFLELTEVTAVVVALPPSVAEDAPEWLRGEDVRIEITSGGETRRESVWNAIQLLPDDVDVIAVHDAARPLIDTDTIMRCIEVAQTGTGAVAGIPLTDTLKRVDESGGILETPARAGLWQAQTPQVFPRDLLVGAYRRAEDEDWPATDDSSLVERMGGAVQMVEASGENIKLTRLSDVPIATMILGQRSEGRS